MKFNTWQDSLGLWHAAVNDDSDQTIAIVPAEGQYGFDTEAEAITAAEDAAKEVSENLSNM